MVNRPRLSIITPILNLEHEQHFKRALRSLLCQTLCDYEVLLIADQGVLDQLTAMEECRDTRLKLLDDCGHVDAGARRNIGIEQCSGRYVLFLDYDDAYCSLSSLQTLYEAIERSGCLAVGGSCIIRDELKRQYIYRHDLINYGFAHECSFADFQNESGFYRFIYNADFLKDSCRFRMLRRFQDSVFLVECLEQAGHFLLIPEIVYIYTKGHRRLEWSCEMLLDHLRGVEIVLDLSLRRDYQGLVYKMLKNILNTQRLRTVAGAWPGEQWAALLAVKKRLTALLLAYPALAWQHPIIYSRALMALRRI